jgi:hypothetical protein
VLTELLLNSASDDEDEENLMPLIAHGGHLQAQQSVMPMSVSDMKSANQRPSTPSTTIDDKDGNDSEGNQPDTLMHSISGRLHFS